MSYVNLFEWSLEKIKGKRVSPPIQALFSGNPSEVIFRYLNGIQFFHAVSTTRVVDAFLEDENEGKAFAVHVSKISKPYWDF